MKKNLHDRLISADALTTVFLERKTLIPVLIGFPVLFSTNVERPMSYTFLKILCLCCFMQATAPPSLQAAWPDPAAPINLSEAGQSASSPRIAVDPSGIATAVWQRSNGSNTIIQSLTQTDPGVWPALDKTVDLSVTGQNASFPEIAINDFGIATAVWQRSNGTNTIIQSLTQTDPGVWPDPAESVDLSATGQNAYNPQIAVDPSGNATAVWSRYNGSNNVIQASYNFYGATITSLSPNFGPAEGRTSVTITGTNFIGVTDVKFGNASASNFTVHSDTSITAIAPPGIVGTVDVTIIAFSETSPITPDCQYTYQSQAQPPLPPSKFKGTVAFKKHAHKHKYHLKAHWKPSPSNVSLYRIYKRSKIVATVSADSKLVFKEHLLYKSSTKKFRVAAVNAQNEESTRKKLHVE